MRWLQWEYVVLLKMQVDAFSLSLVVFPERLKNITIIIILKRSNDPSFLNNYYPSLPFHFWCSCNVWKNSRTYPSFCTSYLIWFQKNPLNPRASIIATAPMSLFLTQKKHNNIDILESYGYSSLLLDSCILIFRY